MVKIEKDFLLEIYVPFFLQAVENIRNKSLFLYSQIILYKKNL